jgi:hypothetical protein
LRRQAEAGEVPSATAIVTILERLLKLASATQKDVWFGWHFDLARICRHKMKIEFLDELYAQIFVCRPAIGSKIVAYAQTLDDETDESSVVRLASLRRFCRE